MCSKDVLLCPKKMSIFVNLLKFIFVISTLFQDSHTHFVTRFENVAKQRDDANKKCEEKEIELERKEGEVLALTEKVIMSIY